MLQTGQVPLDAFLPFFIVTGSTFSASLFALHLTQYICIIFSPPLKKSLSSKCAFALDSIKLAVNQWLSRRVRLFLVDRILRK